MPKRIVPLSEPKIKKAKAQHKPVPLFDGGGLFVLVTPTGGKLWRFKYRFANKNKLLSFGSYPEISIATARKKREEARTLIANGVDPGEVRKAQKAAVVAATENSFEVVAREWHEKFYDRWTPGHAATLMKRLERDVFPWLGARPIGEVKAPELLSVLRRVESRGTLDTAHRIKILAGQVFRYAIATGRAERDPSADLKGALPPKRQEHLAAVTEPKEAAALLRAIDGYSGSFIVKCALQLGALFFVRPGELRHAEWSEMDLDAGVWAIPGPKMKMKQPHIVPLSRQAKEILESLKPLTGSGRYVFPSHRSTLRAMSNNAILAALRRMGYTKDEMTGHGFRAMARTILDEVLHVRVEYIEHQLAHTVRDPNGRAYNRTAHLEERKKMMQQWGDYLDGLKTGAKVLPFTKKAG
ncbi:MAG: tyrosine-type recombinase/integrase [Nitrospirota bacterium]